nr:outer membrane protein transport protein [Pseudomonas syringae group genomosp. 3]
MTHPALAGGIMLYEVASDNIGLVNAGAAARAQGPSTIASNPAGISYLDGTQISTGAQLIYGKVKFDADANTNVPGGNGGNAITPTPGGSFFVSHRIDDHWSAGFGAYGDFGLALDYKNDWAGRYFSQYGSIAGLSMVPTIAYKFDEQWSVGIGVKAMYAMLHTEAAIDRSPLGLTERADGQYKYKDSDWGAGANIGVIYSPQAGTRIGLTYTSAIDLHFEDRLKVSGAGVLLGRTNDTNLGLDVRVPQTATLSLFQQLDSKWALLATVNWQDWSRFGDITADVDTSRAGSVSSAVEAHYKDTYQLAVGTQYQATPKLLWNAGLAYDTSAVSSSNRTVSNPMSAQWRLGTGVTYAVDKGTDLNLSWDMVWMGDLSVDQSKSLSGDRTSGEFSNAWLQTVSGNMTWRF